MDKRKQRQPARVYDGRQLALFDNERVAESARVVSDYVHWRLQRGDSLARIAADLARASAAGDDGAAEGNERTCP